MERVAAVELVEDEVVVVVLVVESSWSLLAVGAGCVIFDIVPGYSIGGSRISVDLCM